MTLGLRRKKLLGVAALAVMAFSVSGCSSLPTVPDWVDPTTWFSGDDEVADNAPTPDLASIPGRPAASTPDDQAKVAESLAADRSNAKYSGETLRGGTEAAAAPPPDVTPAPKVAEKPVEAKPVVAPPPVKVAEVDRSVAQDPSGNTVPGTLPSTPATTSVAALPPPPAAMDAAPAAVAAAEPAPPPAQPVQPKLAMANTAAPVPPPPPAPVRMASVSPSDAELGFKPSSAPPLDTSVSQFVASPIVDRYRETASAAGMAASSAPVTVKKPARKRLHAPSAVAMGGPEHMSGAVVANLDNLPAQSAPPPNDIYTNAAGIPANAVVFFPGDRVSLNGAAVAEVRAAARQFLANGGAGFVRVVGHSSSRTGNMTAVKHLEIIFRKSQDRANAVAKELIRQGVPADRVLVEAVGDSDPVFYESMPKGEDGNRRAEIFFQG